MSFTCQDVNTLVFSDESFSKAYSINTVYFWDDLNISMRGIRRILKPGGVFINTLYTNETLARLGHTKFGYKCYDPKELMDAGENTGFAVKTVPMTYGTAISYIYTRI